MPLVLHSIVPPKMNIDAYRLEYLNTLRKEGRRIKKEYEKTVRTWKKKPKFEMIVSLTRTKPEASVLVGTDNEIYRYVDEGTKRHVIRAKNAPRLAFKTGFTPKTTPRQIGSRRGGRSGKLVRPKRVIHPGTKARMFSKTIAARRKGGFVRAMRLANERATKKVYP